MPRAAIVLAGSGVYDGSEIHEATSLLIHLSRHGVEYTCFAPDEDQLHVIDHVTGQPAEGETRNVLVESARIARGKVQRLSDLSVDAFDAIFFPGGFGAAKNLCTFATDGPGCTVNGDVERVLRDFHGAGKPIGMCCIAPVIAAKVFGTEAGGKGCTVTIGNDADTVAAIGAMGSTNEDRPVLEACVDEANNLVTAPAYMYGDAPPHEVYEGIGAMVEKTLARVGAAV